MARPDRPFQVGLLGAGPRGRARAVRLRALPGVTLVAVADPDPEAAQALARDLDVPAYTPGELAALADAVVIATAAAERIEHAEVALKQGTAAFLEWPPAPSPAGCEALVRLAEEAGAEIGVGRPLPIEPLLAARPAGWTPRLVTLRWGGAATASWPRRIAAAADLLAGFARGAAPQRVEATADRAGGALLESVVAHIRFQNGTAGQLALFRNAPALGPPFHLYAAGGGRTAEAVRPEGPLCLTEPVPEEATTARPPGPHPPPARQPDDLEAFFSALARRQPAPHAAFDALATMRLTQTILERLR